MSVEALCVSTSEYTSRTIFKCYIRECNETGYNKIGFAILNVGVCYLSSGVREGHDRTQLDQVGILRHLA